MCFSLFCTTLRLCTQQVSSHKVLANPVVEDQTPRLFFRKSFELGILLSISQYLSPLIAIQAAFLEFYQSLYSLSCPVKYAIVPAVSRPLFCPVVGSWVLRTQSRVRRLIKDLQNLLTNFFYFPPQWEPKLVCLPGRQSPHAFTNLGLGLSKGS